MSQWKESARRTSSTPHDKCEITPEKIKKSSNNGPVVWACVCVCVCVCVFASERERERERKQLRGQCNDVGWCWWHPTRKSKTALPSSTSCIFLRPVVETRAHQVVLVCSVRITAALILENSPRMIVRAVGKAETRPFTHSRSLEKPLKGCCDQCRLQAWACSDGVLCIYSGQITIFATNHEVKQAILDKSEKNRHFAAKVKATKFASASTGQVRRLCTCTMMYNA